MAKQPQEDMKPGSFMLVSLQEDKAKKLAQVIGNPTCIRILEHLAKGESTESKLSKELDIPLSTVHYNLNQLVQAKLVVVEEFHYSPKGREVNHYKLANRYIIIAPEEEKVGILERIKGVLPAAIITAGIGIGFWISRAFIGGAAMASDARFLPEAAPAAMKAADVMAEGSSAFVAQETAIEQVAVAQPWWQSFPLEWFLIGAGVALLVVLLTHVLGWLRER